MRAASRKQPPPFLAGTPRGVMLLLKMHGDRGRDKKDMKEWVLAGKPGPSSSGAGCKLPALGQAQRWQHRRCERPEAEARGWPKRQG